MLQSPRSPSRTLVGLALDFAANHSSCAMNHYLVAPHGPQRRCPLRHRPRDLPSLFPRTHRNHQHQHPFVSCNTASTMVPFAPPLATAVEPSSCKITGKCLHRSTISCSNTRSTHLPVVPRVYPHDRQTPLLESLPWLKRLLMLSLPLFDGRFRPKPAGKAAPTLGIFLRSSSRCLSRERKPRDRSSFP